MEGRERSQPLSFNEKINSWLEVALDEGITEYEFYNMTLGEITRAIESKRRQHLKEIKEKAQFDYILADAIGRSVSRIYSGNFPSLMEIYPSLFKQEDYQRQEEERKAEISAIRFKQFANSFNKRFKGGNVEE